MDFLFAYVGLFFGGLALTWYSYKKIKTARWIELHHVNELGLCLLDPKLLKGWEKKIGSQPFPPAYYTLINKHSTGTLVCDLFDLEMSQKETLYKRDVARVLTVCAAVFQIRIPAELVLIDDRTKELYALLRREMKTVNILKCDVAKLTHSFSTKELGKYHAMIPTVCKSLYVSAGEHCFPSAENFAKIASKSILRLHHQTVDERTVRILAMVASAITKTPIPKQYVILEEITNMGSLTNALIHYKRPAKLSVIKTDNEPFVEEA